MKSKKDLSKSQKVTSVALTVTGVSFFGGVLAGVVGQEAVAAACFRTMLAGAGVAIGSHVAGKMCDENKDIKIKVEWL